MFDVAGELWLTSRSTAAALRMRQVQQQIRRLDLPESSHAAHQERDDVVGVGLGV